jgi:hypothetical protein
MKHVPSGSFPVRPALLLAALCLAGSVAQAYWPSDPPPLPIRGGAFTDPSYGATVMRVTDASDGDSLGTAYSYWPTFSRDSTHLVFFDLAHGGSYLQDFDPARFRLVGTKRSLFASNPPGGSAPSWEDPIWSGQDNDVIICHEGARIWSYNVKTQAWARVADLQGRLLPGTVAVRQMSRSLNDDVFGFSMQDASYGLVGYGVYQRSTNRVLLKVANADFDEVQVDKTGRYLVAKLNDGSVIVYDLPRRGSIALTDGAPDFAPGHSDDGQGTCIGHDNYNNQLIYRSLGTPHTFRVLHNWGGNWAHGEHLSMLLDDETWVAVSTYEEGAPPKSNDLRSEIFLLRTDGSGGVRHVCHHYSDVTGYWDTPRANISRDGRSIAFTSNWGGSGRLDLFIVRVPEAASIPHH